MSFINGNLIINEFGNGFVNSNNQTIYINKKDIGFAYNGAYVNVEIVKKDNNLLYGKIINFSLIDKKFTCYVHHYYKNDTYLLCPKLTKSNLIIISDNKLNDNKWYNVIVTKIENNKIYGNVITEIENSIDNIIESYFNLTNNNFNININNDNHIDQTNLDTFTIDPENSLDCDDAFSILHTNNETFIYVHISDVAHYINPTIKDFDEIIKRGTTIYGCTKNWPMIPTNYANNICSILPCKETLVYTHEFIYKDNQITFINSYYSKIMSKNKFSYLNINDKFKILYNTAMIIKKDFDEINIINESMTHEMVKIWMIKINIIMSEKINKLFRCHSISKKQNLNIIELYTKQKINNRNDLINIIKYNNDKLLQYLVKTSLSKAYYDVNNIGHYGIGVNNYTHWTSPIRRSCDLLNHCLIKGYNIDITKYLSLLNDSEHLQNSIEQFIESYNIINKIKNNENKYNGIIINITNNGISVYINEFDTKYSIHISKLSTDKLYINEELTELSNKNYSYKLFDNIKLKINNYDFNNIDFILL